MFDSEFGVFMSSTKLFFFANGTDSVLSLKYLREYLHSNNNSHNRDKQQDVLSVALVSIFASL